jgi:MerR family mercuric resistance operon transcriptional regulator
LPQPRRSGAGHRLYDQDTVRRLTFICRARELGFSLKDVRGLLDLVDGGDYTCAEVRMMTLDHTRDIRRKIADLRAIERTRKDIAAHCNRGEIPDCPVIDALFRTPA